MSTDTENSTRHVRFQAYISKEQHAFLRRLAYEKGISGGSAVRKGIILFAKKQGVTLTEEE
jgi:hypothetical protein